MLAASAARSRTSKRNARQAAGALRAAGATDSARKCRAIAWEVAAGRAVRRADISAVTLACAGNSFPRTKARARPLGRAGGTPVACAKDAWPSDRPNYARRATCRPDELAALAPVLVVCLGATAARAVVGPDPRVGALRGKVLARGTGPPVVVTVHPSYVLRLQGPEQDSAFDALVRDLRLATRFDRAT
jgi:uracil-DNA glycosylase